MTFQKLSSKLVPTVCIATTKNINVQTGKLCIIRYTAGFDLFWGVLMWALAASTHSSFTRELPTSAIYVTSGVGENTHLNMHVRFHERFVLRKNSKYAFYANRIAVCCTISQSSAIKISNDVLHRMSLWNLCDFYGMLQTVFMIEEK